MGRSGGGGVCHCVCQCVCVGAHNGTLGGRRGSLVPGNRWQACQQSGPGCAVPQGAATRLARRQPRSGARPSVWPAEARAAAARTDGPPLACTLPCGGGTVLPAAAVLTPLQRSVAQPRRRRRAAWPPRARRRLQQACVVRTCEKLGDVVRHQCIQQSGLGGGQRAPQRCPHNSAAIQPAVRGQGAGCIVSIGGQGLPNIEGGV